MKNKCFKVVAASLAACMALSLAACGSSGQTASTAGSTAASAAASTASSAGTDSASSDVLPDADGNTTAGDYTFPLAETETIKASPNIRQARNRIRITAPYSSV